MSATLKLEMPIEWARPLATRSSIASQVSRIVALEVMMLVGVTPSSNQPGGYLTAGSTYLSATAGEVSLCFGSCKSEKAYGNA